MRRLAACAFLLAALLGCNLPTPSPTPSPIADSVATVTPDRGWNPALAVLTVPIQAFQVTDDDGARAAPISAEQVKAWVDKANEIYAPASIYFSYDPDEDFAFLRSTLLNNIMGKEDANWTEAILFGNQAATANQKLVVFFHYGRGEQPTGSGFSWWDYNFVVMPGFDATTVCGYQNIGMLAHEIGHYLGLPHTFAAIFNNREDAEVFLQSHNGDPKTFDGDGFDDTPPDPYIATFDVQCEPLESVTLNGQVFRLPRENLMSYYEVRSGLSDEQIERARWVLALRMQNGMAMPSNRYAPSPVEADGLTVLRADNCAPLDQDMAPFGAHQWNEGDQLFISAEENCVLELVLPVSRAGRYYLELYMTRAPDFGQIQVSLDGTSLGAPWDGYAPLVMPSGPVILETPDLSQGNHTLTFTVVGNNPQSAGYLFGIDALTLSPGP